MNAETETKPQGAIERDVFHHRLVGVAEEMSAALSRSAFSSMIWDMYDYSCALFTADGVMLAQAETIAAQLGIMELACERIGRVIPVETWREGDVIVCNDPYHGCTHTPDIVMFSPVFSDGRLVALTSTIAHHVDIGGKSPCTTVPDNTEIFGEGLIFPPMKLVKEGVANEEVLAMLGANVRNPEATTGDLRAQMAGCRTGERRLRDVVERYGLERFDRLCAEVLDYGERYVRASLREVEGGESRATLMMEDGIASDEPLELRCRVSIADGAIDVDFTGTSDQRANALNCPWASTISMTVYAVKAAFAPDIAQNGGCARPIRVHAPEGSMLNPRRPAAVGSRHFSQQAVAEVVLKALAPLATSVAYAGSQISFPVFKVGGFDRRPEKRAGRNDDPYFAMTDILGGGGCATEKGDGMSAIDTHGGNCALLSAEVLERISPMRVLRTELVADSGGRGAHRGGLAVRRDYEFLCDDLMINAFVQQTEDYARPWGSAGGEPGAPAKIVFNPDTADEQPLPNKAIQVKAKVGQVLRMQSAGGGGYGAVIGRSAELEARDEEQGYVTKR